MFQTAYDAWIQTHLNARQGERLRRLQEGHLHAEKEMLRTIWWPAFRHLDHLHPEYEVTDFKGGRRFIDLAYIRSSVRIAIEVDGYGPHVRDLSRRQFCDQWVRQMHLLNDGWIVVRIGYDDVEERPRLWQQLLQQMVGRLFGDAEDRLSETDCVEREIVRLALRLGRPIKLADVKMLLGCGYEYARDRMRSLTDKSWFAPHTGGSSRTHSWRLNADRNHMPY